MTYNIRFDDSRAGQLSWAARGEMVAGVMRFHEADLIGVQEALQHQLVDLDCSLPGFQAFGVARDDGKTKGEYSAILYRTARFEFTRGGTFWLSETPTVAGSKSWDAALPRIVTWAQFKDKLTRKIFFHFNTHFDHVGTLARTESARLLINEIARLNTRNNHVIVTGDFNFTEDAIGYQTLVGKLASALQTNQTTLKLHDARYTSATAHHGGDTTFNNFKAPVPKMKIDYIFTTNRVQVFRHGILTDAWNNLYPSDHFPVLAEIVFK